MSASIGTSIAETVRIVGTAGAGCIAGAEELPSRGDGFVTIHRSTSYFWGAPHTIAAVENLAKHAVAMGLGEIYVGDLSPRLGGPLPGQHASHQRGLDADIWLSAGPRLPVTDATQANTTPPSLVRPDRRDIVPELFTPEIVSLIRMAAELPDIDRVLVNPAIKAHLCRIAGHDRGWLHRVRPWYGHSAHMHLGFRCPTDQTECVPMAPPPAGDGCDSTLDWWFAQLDHPAPIGKPPPARPPSTPSLPAFCRALLAKQ